MGVAFWGRREARYEELFTAVGQYMNNVDCFVGHCKERTYETKECNRFVRNDFWEEFVFNSFHSRMQRVLEVIQRRGLCTDAELKLTSRTSQLQYFSSLL